MKSLKPRSRRVFIISRPKQRYKEKSQNNYTSSHSTQFYPNHKDSYISKTEAQHADEMMAEILRETQGESKTSNAE